MASEQPDPELEELLDSALSDFGVRTEVSNTPRTVDASAAATATAPSATTSVSTSAASTSNSNVTAAATPSGVAGLGSTAPLLPRKKKKNKPPPSSDQPNQQADQLAASLSQMMAGLLESERGAGGESSSLVSQGMSDTLAALAAQTKTAVEALEGGGVGAARMEDANEALVAELAAQMQALGGEGEVQLLMDSMMRQLLSKDVLAEPMRDIAERYPAWLERNAASLPPEDLRRFRKQHEHVQEICQLYETDPENFPRLVQLLQEMQDCGQPPQDIVKELAPGMEFGMDGMPKLNAGDASTMPGDLNNCSIM